MRRCSLNHFSRITRPYILSEHLATKRRRLLSSSTLHHNSAATSTESASTAALSGDIQDQLHKNESDLSDRAVSSQKKPRRTEGRVLQQHRSGDRGHFDKAKGRDLGRKATQDLKVAGDDPHTQPRPHKDREVWQVQKDALKRKFGEQGWQPRKKLSPDTLTGIRALHEQDPERYTTPVLAEHFKVSAEAIRRILKSKWRPSAEKQEERRARWTRRHDRIWDVQSELGLRPKRTKDRKLDRPGQEETVIPSVDGIAP